MRTHRLCSSLKRHRTVPGESRRCPHRRRLRLRGGPLSRLDNSGMCRRPRHPERPSDLRNAATGLACRHCDCATQSAGRARPRWDLRDRLSERPPRTPRLDAAPPSLVPDQRDRPFPIRQIPRRRPHALPPPTSPPPRTGKPRRILRRRLQMHDALTTLVGLDVSNANSRQIEQDRPSVVQAPGLSSAASATARLQEVTGRHIQARRTPVTTGLARSRSKSPRSEDHARLPERLPEGGPPLALGCLQLPVEVAAQLAVGLHWATTLHGRRDDVGSARHRRLCSRSMAVGRLRRHGYPLRRARTGPPRVSRT